MFKNYFKTAWRNVVNNKGYSALNIFGLATGMAVALLIGLWVYYQYSYDRFLPGYETIYSVKLRSVNNGVIDISTGTSYPLADAIKKDVPGVQYVAQTDWMSAHSLMVGDKKIYQGGAIAGTDFLKIFRYPFVKGNADNALGEPYSIVLSESTAKALFGNVDPINKTVRLDNSNNLKVTGILKDVPSNSTLKFNFLVPFTYAAQNFDDVKNNLNNWRNNDCQTFIALQPNASPARVKAAISLLEKNYNPEDYNLSKAETFIQPITSWHLYSRFTNGVATGGLIDYVKTFSITGLLVLLIACINFMNLSTARSEKRAREVGIRKAVGCQRMSLILQFLTESVVITLIAFLLSLLIVLLVLPSFNTLTQADISLPYSDPFFWLIMISYVLITGMLAGSRPAFYLSSFNPVKVLKGKIRAERAAAYPRKVLVVLQFSCSIALIISTIIVYQQIQYAKERPIGYDNNRLMMTDASSDLSRNYIALKAELLQSGVVTSVTKSSSPVTDIWSNQRINDWQGKYTNESLKLSTIAGSDADYFKTMGMQISSGRNFTNSRADSLNVLLNEAAVKRMRYKDPLNQVITWHDVPQRVRVIGVVKDALMASPFSPAEPTIFIHDPNWSNVITYRLSPTVNTQQAITTLTTIFNKYNPSYPYQFHFADENYAAKFQLETLIGKLAGFFAALAIFISCLGLFGLAAYTAEQRTKEIGIRKVLGASISQVWFMLSKEFIVLVMISSIIASPFALYYLHNWLQQYNYRITISPLIFIITAIAAIVITILTISFQAIKAAIVNPVKSLRTE